MKNELLESFLAHKTIPYETDVDLKKKTWIHRGGKADYFIMPQNTLSLEILMTYLYHNKIQHLLIGCTSNLYVLNSTNIPVVVSTLHCNQYAIKDSVIECDCGVQVAKLARQMINNGIKGFEYLTKLPGTIGAAICNNSSVKKPENSIAERLVDIDIITPTGLRTIKAADLHFTFRSSDLKKKLLEGTILRARLRKEIGNIVEMQQIAKENEAERLVLLDGPSQNLGCTVHRPFCNGPMSLKYRVLCSVYSKFLSFGGKDELNKKKLLKNFILSVTGHKRLIPYVSDKLIITFIWKDENADDVFDEYLEFMREIYKTDQIEIEIIK